MKEKVNNFKPYGQKKVKIDTSNKIVWLVYFIERDPGEGWEVKTHWEDGDFEPYDWYETKEEADKICMEQNKELARNGRGKFVKAFVRKVFEAWAEKALA